MLYCAQIWAFTHHLGPSLTFDTHDQKSNQHRHGSHSIQSSRRAYSEEWGRLQPQTFDSTQSAWHRITFLLGQKMALSYCFVKFGRVVFWRKFLFDFWAVEFSLWKFWNTHWPHSSCGSQFQSYPPSRISQLIFHKTTLHPLINLYSKTSSAQTSKCPRRDVTKSEFAWLCLMTSAFSTIGSVTSLFHFSVEF